jgi:hypothetical protein
MDSCCPDAGEHITLIPVKRIRIVEKEMSYIQMRINILQKYFLSGTISLILLWSYALKAQVYDNQNSTIGLFPQEKKDNPTVSISYKDTLILPSFTEFDLQVKMITGNEISAISLGFYFPPEYLEILDMVMADSTQGFSFSVIDSLFTMAWSNINPIHILDDDTIIILKIKTLDISALTGTLRLEIYEMSEFADQSANIIDSVVLEMPEIKFLEPDPVDTTSDFYVKVYPNPFDDFTTIFFSIKEESRVKISLINRNGMEIQMLTDATYPEGYHQMRLDGLDFAKGIFLLEFEIINSEGIIKKLIKILNIR